MGGSLTDKELEEAKAKAPNAKYFIEGGTYKGVSARMASKYFDQVYTMEILERLFIEACATASAEGITNIKHMLGDTLKLLPGVIQEVKDGGVFFLDSHISGFDSGWNGEDRVPLLKELEIILDGDVGESLFILDDVRLWKQQVWDWKHIDDETILRLFLTRGYTIVEYVEMNDRLYILAK
jgi:SAM-dependent methyltransferase